MHRLAYKITEIAYNLDILKEQWIRESVVVHITLPQGVVWSAPVMEAIQRPAASAVHDAQKVPWHQVGQLKQNDIAWLILQGEREKNQCSASTFVTMGLTWSIQ